MAVDTKKIQERDELHRAIWAIADETAPYGSSNKN